MDQSHPLTELFPGAHGRLVETLVRMPAALFTGRELARAAGVTPMTAGRALPGLVASGLVTRRPVGRAYQYAVNTGHYSFEWLRRLVVNRDALIETIRRYVDEEITATPDAVVLFGSFRHGTATTRSDVDICILADDVDDDLSGELQALQDRVEALTGNVVRYIILNVDELAGLVESHDPFALSLVSDAVTLAGNLPAFDRGDIAAAELERLLGP